ncbi:Glycosyltransferase involved in cell wall bisynthesis [Algoriphagus ornithinivorans]|uniref:Glycosyltransferase involved in cell wall bisynthesis n=1 Tax=Algoriphagus ornithinivorans TaxID=226506 RepID=A0A1I5HMG4_9BACT|nr:glycosyltransferase family 2 protein [Algoriphagus ornithinivorans]SFO49021.1 Glycosyltransferase involved in cell wall bisynthesis [Algoriphagus ornithinivorans]
MAKVSVIIPSYGRPEFLQKSIQSVLSQSLQDWELIVVDDNGVGSVSQVQTQTLLNEYRDDPRIHYHIQEENRGGSAARNIGWISASGKFICFLDNDDEFYPEKLKTQVQSLESTGLKMTVCRFDSFKNGKKVRTSPKVPEMDSYLIPFALGKINFASGSTLMISKSLLEKVDGYDETFRRKQDVELMIRLLVEESLHVDDQILVRLNIDDRANIPSVENFKKFQNLFNLKFNNLFETFPQKAQQEIKQYEITELAKVALWNKDWRLFLRLYFTGGLNFTTQFNLGADLVQKFVTYYLK